MCGCETEARHAADGDERCEEGVSFHVDLLREDTNSELHFFQEFETLKPSNTVYKLIGPVLIEQDQSEAKANVDKRLEFIRSEL